MDQVDHTRDMIEIIFSISVLAWLAVAMITLSISMGKDRNFIVWLIYSVLLTPFAFLHALTMKPGRLVECNMCRADIKPTARVCPYCRHEMSPGKQPGEVQNI